VLFDPNSDGANNHSIIPAVDTIALARIAGRVMPGMSLSDFRAVLELSGSSRATLFESNGSSTGSEGDTLPNALVTLGRWHGVDVSITPDVTVNGWANYNTRGEYHNALATLAAHVNASRVGLILDGGEAGSGYMRLDQFSATDLATLAAQDDDLGIRVRFALENNSPYVLTNAPLDVINAAGRYDLGNYTDQNRQDLVSRFVEVMDANRNNVGTGTAGAQPNGGGQTSDPDGTQGTPAGLCAPMLPMAYRRDMPCVLGCASSE
jgi:hypothetical protein